jgi:hypothetical protein
MARTKTSSSARWFARFLSLSLSVFFFFALGYLNLLIYEYRYFKDSTKIWSIIRRNKTCRRMISRDPKQRNAWGTFTKKWNHQRVSMDTSWEPFTTSQGHLLNQREWQTWGWGAWRATHFVGGRVSKEHQKEHRSSECCSRGQFEWLSLTGGGVELILARLLGSACFNLDI